MRCRNLVKRTMFKSNKNNSSDFQMSHSLMRNEIFSVLSWCVCACSLSLELEQWTFNRTRVSTDHSIQVFIYTYNFVFFPSTLAFIPLNLSALLCVLCWIKTERIDVGIFGVSYQANHHLTHTLRPVAML